MTIRIIEHGNEDYLNMIALRMDILLRPIGAPESYVNKEKEKEDILIGAFEEKELLGSCILTRINDEIVQLRQMAVKQDIQKKGIGSAILRFAESIAKEKGFKQLILHARDNALTFYSKNGYSITGPQFFEVNIPHHKMEKKL